MADENKNSHLKSVFSLRSSKPIRPVVHLTPAQEAEQDIEMVHQSSQMRDRSNGPWHKPISITAYSFPSFPNPREDLLSRKQVNSVLTPPGEVSSRQKIIESLKKINLESPKDAKKNDKPRVTFTIPILEQSNEGTSKVVNPDPVEVESSFEASRGQFGTFGGDMLDRNFEDIKTSDINSSLKPSEFKPKRLGE